MIYGAAALYVCFSLSIYLSLCSSLCLSLWPCINGNPAKTSPSSAAQNDRSRVSTYRATGWVTDLKLFWREVYKLYNISGSLTLVVVTTT